MLFGEQSKLPIAYIKYTKYSYFRTDVLISTITCIKGRVIIKPTENFYKIYNLNNLEEYQLISEKILICMQSSTLLRNRSLNDVSKTVLRLINNKICPLNQEKMNKIIKYRRKQKLTRVATEPNCIISLPPTSKHLPKNKSAFPEFEQRTIGEHFNQFETRELLHSRIQDKDYELMTEKINQFIWTRRQEIVSSLSRKQERKEVESQKQAVSQDQSRLSKNSTNISHCLIRLRKKLKEEYQRESEAIQTPIWRYNEMEEHGKIPTATNFFEQNYGIEKVMERYPLRESKLMLKQDLGKRFESEMLSQLNNEANDKYTRMRININHRKIVSLK